MVVVVVVGHATMCHSLEHFHLVIFRADRPLQGMGSVAHDAFVVARSRVLFVRQSFTVPAMLFVKVVAERRRESSTMCKKSQDGENHSQHAQVVTELMGKECSTVRI